MELGQLLKLEEWWGIKDTETIIPEERTEQEIDNSIWQCGVSKRHRQATKEKIDTKIWESVSGFFDGNSYFIWGKAGTGKTFLASALINHFVYTHPDVKITDNATGVTRYGGNSLPRIVSVPDLLLRVRASFKEHSDMSESSIIEDYSTIKRLFLDDIGVEKTSDWSLQTLYSIIDRRYREMRQTIITSNLSLEEISDKVGDRIASRIAEMCKIIELKGKDRRLA